MNTNKVTLAALAAMAVTLTLAVVPALTTQAFAKITEEPIACKNPSGSEPGGQQPECKTKNPKFEQETENQNPTGFAPPGQNK